MNSAQLHSVEVDGQTIAYRQVLRIGFRLCRPMEKMMTGQYANMINLKNLLTCFHVVPHLR